ncbi:replication endonuclease [Laribacter hongkongensis]|uniref:Replication endonuclease n=1 Tax=Laribacter hongkongensis TaxID=168471 RepID=A0ABD4SNZ6_9NEIS|nr:replication endonuclease [Laribacter hongkongensis]MCG9025177.1 replication endonuclease [Laribacter hongkongensis]MCG9099765.1 replication endonuclease [Laribacter hongkongensis]MCG9103433.1 replication endonuclease [Laribacter hongkongensis]MCG9111243.1 replication endonuclease [Laribacter hongkongensis]MCG9118180.1 replication endonuclease [Laribacter hongkongensis]
MLARIYREDSAWRAGLLADLPAGLRQHWQTTYDRIFQRQGLAGDVRRAANSFLRQAHRRATGTAAGLPLDTDGDTIDTRARDLCRQARAALSRPAGHAGIETGGLPSAERLAQAVAIELPATGSPAGLAARLVEDRFWLRRVRTQTGRRRESLEIAAGLVHKRRSAYVSADTLAVVRRTRARNAALLAATRLVSDAGDDVPLDEIVAASVSNPAIRRAELMTRIAGMERASLANGHAAEFLTLTAPSAFHARLSNGRKNPRWQGSTPREAQAWMTKQWGRARSAFARAGLSVYGLRIAEPHHDGTPHWHVLLMGEAEALKRAIAIATDYWQREFAEELTSAEARRARAYSVTIDRQRGSAAGYVVKYVCKNIDGAGVSEGDFEAGTDAASGAERVRAWASIWGIRQFQFFGAAPVTLWREARRAADRISEVSGALAVVIDAADRGAWDDYTAAMRGRAVSLRYRSALNRYGEPMQIIAGLTDTASGETLTTRVKTWRMEWSGSQKSGVSRSWTRVNNCTRGHFSTEGETHHDYQEHRQDERPQATGNPGRSAARGDQSQHHRHRGGCGQGDFHGRNHRDGGRGRAGVCHC